MMKVLSVTRRMIATRAGASRGTRPRSTEEQKMTSQAPLTTWPARCLSGTLRESRDGNPRLTGFVP